MLPPAQATARCASGYMLENPCIPHYRASVKSVLIALDSDYGDNVQGAENQQERLVDSGWKIAGTMFHREPRPDSIRILRGHTPDIPWRDDEMVQPAWRHADSG